MTMEAIEPSGKGGVFPCASKVLAIHKSWTLKPSGRGMLFRRRELLEFRANPRTPSYMLGLLGEMRGRHFPDARMDVLGFDTIDGMGNAELIERMPESFSEYGAVVLLYPDALGLEFGKIEKALLNAKVGSLYALNGRRRMFRLDMESLGKLRTRRSVSRLSWISDALIGVALVAASAAWAVGDALKGRGSKVVGNG